FYYECLSYNFQSYLDNIATGTTIPNVPLKGLRSYEFRIPPITEQKAITSVLSSLDDKIDLLHRQNKTLESMAETLFRQWFIEEAQDEWPEKSLNQYVE
ncbi:restriction endonuclease subunit S, partial [Enterobacter hormaechei]|nr:restriction endonuclease subunit S [Enterobacter hormaechei]